MRRKIYLLWRSRKTGKEKEDNIWRRTIYFLRGVEKEEKEEYIRRKKIYIFGEVKKNGGEKGRKYIYLCRGKEIQGRKRRKIYFLRRRWRCLTGCWRGWPHGMIICKRPVPPDDHLQEAVPSG